MKPAIINSRWELIVTDHLAQWDALQDWERCRFKDMEERLHRGMVLYDVGTEEGWQSAIYASFVGAENMVLIEPASTSWPNIRLIWEANWLRPPLANVHALLDERTTSGRDRSLYHNCGWPACSDGGETTARAYAYISDPATSVGVAHWRLDDLVLAIARPPDAITIDVEGAELAIVKGADAVLAEIRPTVWMSVHPDLMRQNYGTSPELLEGYMHSHGYKGVLLGKDHEEHWVWLP